MTLGSNGAVGLASDTIVNSSGVHVNVADTVGAGDAFMSALLARLDDCALLNYRAIAALSEDTLADSLAYANRVAALACTRRGADPPTRLQLAQWNPLQTDK